MTQTRDPARRPSWEDRPAFRELSELVRAIEGSLGDPGEER